MAKLTLIKKPGCVPCSTMQVQLDGEGIKYDVIDIAEEPTAIDHYDLTSVPVLFIEKEGEETIRLNGFQPVDKIKALI